MDTNFNFDVNKIIAWMTNRWGRRSSLFLILFIIGIGLLVLLTDGAISKITPPQIILILTCEVATFIFWYFTVRVPKNKQGKIGIALSIYAENNEQQRLIDSDFIQEFREILGGSESRELFHIVNIPRHHSLRIQTFEQADSYRRVARCHMIVYGRTRERKENGKSIIKVSLNCEIVHRKIKAEVSKAFSQDITEVFPGKLNIDSENECQEFEITSNWLGLSARYIVGTAALLSADPDLAQSIFEPMYEILHKQKPKLPAIKKIKQRIRLRLIDTYAFQITYLHSLWDKNNNSIYLEKTKNFLNKLGKIDPGNYSARLSRSINYFVLDQDPQKALKEVLACRGVRDASWRYNYAFLLAYIGRLDDAKNAYERAFDHTDHTTIPLQCEIFIERVLQKEPKKIQLHYFLGLINWHGKGDLNQAIKDIEKFIELAPDDAVFSKMKRIALANIETIKGELML